MVRISLGLLALPVAQVVEICRVLATIAPGTAGGPLLGTAMVRGQPTAIYDLAALLGGPSTAEPAASARLVIVTMPAGAAALRVDEVVGVQALDASSLRALALPGGEERRVGRFDMEFARLVDGAGLVAAAEAPQEVRS